MKLTLDQIGAMSSLEARNDLAVLGALSKALGRPAGKLFQLLVASHGRTLVKNVLASLWPSGAQGRSGRRSARRGPSGPGVTEVDLEKLGGINAAAARSDAELIEALASLLGLSTGVVKRRLHAAHGRHLLRNLFQDRWPAREEDDDHDEDDDGEDEDEDDEEEDDKVAHMTVGEALHSPEVLRALSEILRVSVSKLRGDLSSGRGQTRLRSALARDSSGSAEKKAKETTDKKTTAKKKTDKKTTDKKTTDKKKTDKKTAAKEATSKKKRARKTSSGSGPGSGSRANERSEDNNSYAVLELEPGATLQQVKSAYRRLARVHHPDHGGTHEGFVRLEGAYRLLRAKLEGRRGASSP